MLDAIITVFAIFGFTFAIKETSLLSRPRNWIIRHNTFFANLLSCYFCCGFYSGLAVYLLHENNYDWRRLILWGLAGSAISFIFNALIIKLTWFKEQ